MAAKLVVAAVLGLAAWLTWRNLRRGKGHFCQTCSCCGCGGHCGGGDCRDCRDDKDHRDGEE